MPKILLTGAAGRIGTAFRRYVDHRYDLRLADRDLDRLGDPGGHEALALDVADLQACRRACRDVDTVVHLAADSAGRTGFYPSLLENNIKGTYNIFQAAQDQGCRRVVYASSVQVIEGYPLDVQAHPESPLRPTNMYAVSKCFGEAVAHHFAYAEGLSSIVVRIGSFEHNPLPPEPDARVLSTFISARDLGQLLVRCIEVAGVQFAVVHGVSNNRFKRMDLTATRQLLGYRPRDDAFEIYGVGLRHRERWYRESYGSERADEGPDGGDPRD